MLVGTDDGTLWQSLDGGATWTQITGWVGSGVGDVKDLSFINDHQGIMVVDSAAPVGTVLLTITGGNIWTVLDTPPNSGLNVSHLVTNRLGYVVGKVNNATAVILKITPVV